MNGDTPIYDAVCRAVGPPPHEDDRHAEQTRVDDPTTAELSVPAGDTARDAPAP
ncbi:hypothetical protein ACQPX6_22855 [Actinomycetospora sp. CA-101289]|uniref:hypothetical protein n=1 Tax=Actinomycetospora sp. CA-101289 TaxID=3239893 RepID=UPI003D96A0F3